MVFLFYACIYVMPQQYILMMNITKFLLFNNTIQQAYTINEYSPLFIIPIPYLFFLFFFMSLICFYFFFVGVSVFCSTVTIHIVHTETKLLSIRHHFLMCDVLYWTI